MDKPITIVCWKWNGWRPYYDYRHVNRLKRMLEQHMTGPYNLVCVTDDPVGVECETFPLWRIPEAEGLANGKPNCFVRLRMFEPEMIYWFGERVLSIDLDCNIYRDLRPLLTDEPFKCARGHHSYLNGSMWQLSLGTHSEIWNDYHPVETPKLISNTKYRNRVISGSDQAWMSIKLPTAPRWTEADGVYQRMHMPIGGLPKDARVLFFAGGLKPWDERCKNQCPEFYLPL